MSIWLPGKKEVTDMYADVNGAKKQIVSAWANKNGVATQVYGGGADDDTRDKYGYIPKGHAMVLTNADLGTFVTKDWKHFYKLLDTNSQYFSNIIYTTYKNGIKDYYLGKYKTSDFINFTSVSGVYPVSDIKNGMYNNELKYAANLCYNTLTSKYMLYSWNNAGNANPTVDQFVYTASDLLRPYFGRRYYHCVGAGRLYDIETGERNSISPGLPNNNITAFYKDISNIVFRLFDGFGDLLYYREDKYYDYPKGIEIYRFDDWFSIGYLGAEYIIKYSDEQSVMAAYDNLVDYIVEGLSNSEYLTSVFPSSSVLSIKYLYKNGETVGNSMPITDIWDQASTSSAMKDMDVWKGIKYGKGYVVNLASSNENKSKFFYFKTIDDLLNKKAKEICSFNSNKVFNYYAIPMSNDSFEIIKQGKEVITM